MRLHLVFGLTWQSKPRVIYIENYGRPRYVEQYSQMNYPTVGIGQCEVESHELISGCSILARVYVLYYVFHMIYATLCMHIFAIRRETGLATYEFGNGLY